MKIIDINCFDGHWPFRRIKNEGYANITSQGREMGITTQLVSSLDAVFYQDPEQGDEALAEVIHAPDRHVLSVNPARPSAVADLALAVPQFSPVAVRIHPTLHGYRLCDPCMRPLIQLLSMLSLPLIITATLEDPRQMHMVTPRALDAFETESMIQSNELINYVFTNAAPGFIKSLATQERQFRNLYFDTSGLKNPGYDTVNDLLRTIPADRLLYGSNYPLYVRRGSLYLVTRDGVPEETQGLILHRNAERLFGL